MNFCTLFDSFYLSRGLLMYKSLKQHTDDFHLYIFAFDDLCHEILLHEKLENTSIISLSEFETPELLAVKNSRSKAEYCWTCTPSTIDYVLNKLNVQDCTYIDADLFFYQSPKALTDELENKKNVLITEHRYSKLAQMHELERAGRFCVQFITFTQDEESKNVLNTWREQCIDWCYARYEEGKFGDQKYLDEWPEKYSNVHILNHLGGGVAPWNVQQYRIVQRDNVLYGIEKNTGKEFPVIFYHFHFVRFYQSYIDIGWYFISNSVKNKIYKPYIERLLEIEKNLEKKYPGYKMVLLMNKSAGVKDFIKYLFKKITKYNTINPSY